MADPVSPILRLPGADILYEIEGIGAGLPILTVHGGPGVGSAYWKPELTRELGSYAPLVFYDQRGSGRSTGSAESPTLTLDTFVGDLEALRSALRLDKAIMLAHSFGALIAQVYAARYPESIAALILVEPDPPTRPLWQSYADVVRRRQRPDDVREMEAIQGQRNWIARPDSLSRFFQLAMSSMFLGGSAPAGFGERFAGILPENLATPAAMRASLGDWDHRDLLATLRCPVLLVFGEEPVFSEEAVAAVHRGIAGSTLVRIPGASHFPFVESPAAFGSEVRRFLAHLNVQYAASSSKCMAASRR